jgi:hypothetical protein
MTILSGRLPGQRRRTAGDATTGEPGTTGRRRRPGLVGALAIAVGVLGSGICVWQSTSAVFSSTTANAGNSWTAGSVTLTDDDSGSALFSASGLVPGSSGSNCITVSYSGNVATTVRLYASASSDTSALAQYLDVTRRLRDLHRVHRLGHRLHRHPGHVRHRQDRLRLGGGHLGPRLVGVAGLPDRLHHERRHPQRQAGDHHQRHLHLGGPVLMALMDGRPGARRDRTRGAG